MVLLVSRSISRMAKSLFDSQLRAFAFATIFVSVCFQLAVADTWTVEVLIYDLETPEGPVWDAENDRLFFTEIFAHKVHEYDPANGAFGVIRSDSGGANGMAFDGQNRLLMCEMLGRRVSRLETDGSITTLWEAEQPGRGGPNDITISSIGNAYFTMPRHGTIYRITPDDKVSPFIDNLPGINGVLLSNDEQTLFVTEYRARKVHAFPIDDKRGTVAEGKTFAEIKTEGEEHGADGMAIDSHDQLYVACLGGVWIFDTRTGTQTGMISIPDEKVTNCTFAGSDNTLYITSQKGLFVARRSLR